MGERRDYGEIYLHKSRAGGVYYNHVFGMTLEEEAKEPKPTGAGLSRCHINRSREAERESFDNGGIGGGAGVLLSGTGQSVGTSKFPMAKRWAINTRPRLGT